MAREKSQNPSVKYCPTDKYVRMRSVVVRAPRFEGQKWITFGFVCPVCHHEEFDWKVLTEGYQTAA